MDVEIVSLKEAELKPVRRTNLGFGKVFSNRMFTQRYSPGKGWHDAVIGPYAPLELDPATAVLHYSQTIFEGMKAYRRPDGDINLFRPWENMNRFNLSAQRMAMPQVDDEEHLEAIIKLIELEQEWVPDPPGTLYIRPVMLGVDAALGVHSSSEYLHYIIVGPAGNYFREGFNPIPVYITDKYVRAVQGGTGEAKTGGNYAASLVVSDEARAKGYSQVLWLDGRQRRYIEEVGAMNICFVYEGDHIVTPALSGSILPGVTRLSVLQLGRDLGYRVSEARLDVYDVLADIEAGRITEVFGCGTAAVIAPVGKLGMGDKEYVLNDYECGPVSRQMYRELTDIQFGRVPDRFDWTLRIPAGESVPVI
jgi:branched-chain amino acid aminotransferase